MCPKKLKNDHVTKRETHFNQRQNQKNIEPYDTGRVIKKITRR